LNLINNIKTEEKVKKYNTMNNEEYDSDSDSDMDIRIENIIYDPEEVSKHRFCIVLCELYNYRLHGYPCLPADVEKHFLVIYRFKSLNQLLISNIAYGINTEYCYLENQSHKIFRNYKYIISQPNYIKPEIAECIYLETNEFVAIKKTFWIKIIQRAWKKVYKQRQCILQKRCNVTALIYRERKGKWPKDCLNYPSLNGLLV
jgi:hypothetical protein